MTEQNLELVWINDKYIKYLKRFSPNVRDNKQEKRPYIGVLFKIKDFLYVAPLGSPKEKHINLNPELDTIFKILPSKINYNHKNPTLKERESFEKEYLGIINFNNMIPITIENIKNTPLNSFNEKQQVLHNKQIRIITSNKELILKKAKRLYNRHTRNKLPKHVKNLCNNFLFLEEKCKEWEQERLKGLAIKQLKEKYSKNKEKDLER